MINVVLADHERIFRIGMASILGAEDDLRIVGQPSTAAQLIHCVESFRPHVAILSSNFLQGDRAIEQACARQRTAMLLLRDYEATEKIGHSESFQGVIDRSTDETTVLRHVRQLAGGGGGGRKLSSKASQTEGMEAVGLRVRQRLTAEEMAIIACVVRGFKNREIAQRLGSTEPSVKNSLRRIFDKTGVYGRLELALFVVHHRMMIAAPGGGLATASPPALRAWFAHWNVGQPLNVS
jgi:DNA-binding NarL/FixJ family response regulator